VNIFRSVLSFTKLTGKLVKIVKVIAVTSGFLVSEIKKSGAEPDFAKENVV
jgi:hypothetical protein